MTTEDPKPKPDPNPNSTTNPDAGRSAAPPPPDGGQDTADGYMTHVREVLTAPDGFFDPVKRSPQLFGLITTGVFLGLVFFEALMGRVTRFSNWGFEFSYLTYAIKVTLAIGVPIAAVLFVLMWQAGRSGNQSSLDFFIEKFGAALILPSVFILLAIPLEILDITIHSWFRGAALILIYVAVFMMSYLYAAPRRLNVAVLFVVGFYFFYRLMLLLF